MTGFYKYGTAGHTETELVTTAAEALEHEYISRGGVAEHSTWEAATGYFALTRGAVRAGILTETET